MATATRRDLAATPPRASSSTSARLSPAPTRTWGPARGHHPRVGSAAFASAWREFQNQRRGAHVRVPPRINHDPSPGGVQADRRRELSLLIKQKPLAAQSSSSARRSAARRRTSPSPVSMARASSLASCSSTRRANRSGTHHQPPASTSPSLPVEAVRRLRHGWILRLRAKRFGLRRLAHVAVRPGRYPAATAHHASHRHLRRADDVAGGRKIAQRRTLDIRSWC